MSLLTTPSQTVGPYLRIGFTALAVDAIAPPDAAGERLTIEGRAVDGDGKPVSDAVLEVWQADAGGKYAHSEDATSSEAGKFRGFGRILTDAARRIPLHHHQARARPGSEGRDAGATSGRHRVHARIAQASADAHLLSR